MKTNIDRNIMAIYTKSILIMYFRSRVANIEPIIPNKVIKISFDSTLFDQSLI